MGGDDSGTDGVGGKCDIIRIFDGVVVNGGTVTYGIDIRAAGLLHEIRKIGSIVVELLKLAVSEFCVGAESYTEYDHVGIISMFVCDHLLDFFVSFQAFDFFLKCQMDSVVRQLLFHAFAEHIVIIGGQAGVCAVN